MKEQISRSLTVRIWGDGRARLPKNDEAMEIELSAALDRATEMFGHGFTSGEIRPLKETLSGWWEMSTKDERDAAPPADHADIIALAVMIAKRESRQRDLLERSGWASSADMREQMEKHAARLGDDLCELATRMNRLCRGDKTALDLIGPAWPDAPKVATPDA